MTDLFEVTEAGFRVASLSEAKEKFDELNKGVFGSDIDLRSHTPQNQIAGINAQVWYEVGEQIFKAALYGSSINHAPGKFLDAFGTLLDVPRKVATYSKVEARLKGEAGTVVDEGSLIQNTRGDQFRLETAVIIEDGGSLGTFIALEPGPIPVTRGSVNEIVSVGDSRWKSVNNENEGLIGQNMESDAEYRANLKTITALAATSTISSLNSIFKYIGATKVNILENSTASTATISNIEIPPRSLFVIADGGTISDLTTAYEQRRPLGINTRSAIAANKEWSLNDTKNIGGGVLRYNGKKIEGINTASYTSLTSLVNTLNYSFTDQDVSFGKSGNILMMFYDWSPTASGLTQEYGNDQDVMVRDDLQLLSIEIEQGTGHFVRGKFNQKLQSISNSTYKIVYKDNTEDSGNLTSDFHGNFARWITPNSIRDRNDILSFQISFIIQGECVKATHQYSDVDVSIVDQQSSTEAPSRLQVGVIPSSTQIRAYMTVFGTVTKYQYRGFDGVDYINKLHDGTPYWLNYNTSGNNRELNISGFTTNRDGCWIEIRAWNGDKVSNTVQVEFSTKNSGPTPVIDMCSVDGKDIMLTMDQDLLYSSRSASGGLSWWNATFNGTRIQVVEEKTCGKMIHLKLQSAAPVGSNPNIVYSPTQTTIKSIYGNAAAFTITHLNLKNNTKSHLPARPRLVEAFRIDDQVTLSWDENSDGGDAIDGYEYSVSYNNGSIWEDWVSVSNSTRKVVIEKDVIGRIPNLIKVRASNPNTRIVQSLGLDGNETLTPIVRPVEKNLKVSIKLVNPSELTGDALNQIKNAIIERVSNYSLGETIWVNDILAVAELIPGSRVGSITATHGGIDVNDVSQEGFIRWVIESKDIVFA